MSEKRLPTMGEMFTFILFTSIGMLALGLALEKL